MNLENYQKSMTLSSRFLLVFCLLVFCFFSTACLKEKEQVQKSFSNFSQDFFQERDRDSIVRESYQGILIYRIYRKEPNLKNLTQAKKALDKLKATLKKDSKISLDLTRKRLTISGELSSLELEELLKRAYQEKIISEIIVSGFLIKNSANEQNKL